MHKKRRKLYAGWVTVLMVTVTSSVSTAAVHNHLTDSLATTKTNKINPRRERPFGVYGVIYNIPAYSSFAISYFPISTINTEVGIGILGLYGQLTYHVRGSVKGKRHTFYMGGTIVEGGNFGTSMMSFYFPVGIKWIGYNGFGVSFEIPAFKLDQNIPSLIFKIGYQF